MHSDLPLLVYDRLELWRFCQAMAFLSFAHKDRFVAESGIIFETAEPDMRRGFQAAMQIWFA